ncbi:MAG: DUF1638 domain-containing protein [Desulfobacter sp.]|nr:DUF1638 domain-containing protein [Desulfobacter sp.]
MKNKAADKPAVIACSIFRREIKSLMDKGELNADIRYLNSMLHMQPENLAAALDTAIEKVSSAGRKVVLLYGECHNRMDKYDNRPDIQRLKGCNCVEIILGHGQYRTYSKAGAFFLMPEWTSRWKEIFKNELDLKGEIAKEFMKEMHTFFLYIDTGIVPVPTETLDEISHTLGLPWKSIRIDMNYFLKALKTAVDKFDS